jgi:hypothetical protein
MPSSWFDYNKRLKHDDRKYYLESLQCHLRIEKYFRNRHRNAYSDVKTKVNVIDIDKNIKKNKLQANNNKKFKKNGSNPKYQNNNNNNNNNKNIVLSVQARASLVSMSI